MARIVFYGMWNGPSPSPSCGVTGMGIRSVLVKISEGPLSSKKNKPFAQIEREQDAFDRQLEKLLPEHEGQFILFKDEQPVAFFQNYEEAYRAGLNQFGTNDTFLVSEVKRREPMATSLSWGAGVSFG